MGRLCFAAVTRGIGVLANGGPQAAKHLRARGGSAFGRTSAGTPMPQMMHAHRVGLLRGLVAVGGGWRILRSDGYVWCAAEKGRAWHILRFTELDLFM